VQERGENRETARLEAFSDGVFAIAATILVLDLRLPRVQEPTTTALLHGYFTMAAVLRVRLELRDDSDHVDQPPRADGVIHRIDGLLMFTNGFVLFMIATLAFPTALVATTSPDPPPRVLCSVYAVFVLATSGAWNLVMLAMKPERGLLRSGVPASIIATTRRRVAMGFVSMQLRRDLPS